MLPTKPLPDKATRQYFFNRVLYLDLYSKKKFTLPLDK